jgi:hypothetical protein
MGIPAVWQACILAHNKRPSSDCRTDAEINAGFVCSCRALHPWSFNAVPAKNKEENFVRLVLKKILNEEIVHFAQGSHIVKSRFNLITSESNGKVIKIKMPVSVLQKAAGALRLTRRLTRLDKMCVIPSADGYIAFWQGGVYHIGNTDFKPVRVLTMTGCRNPIHSSIACIDGKEFFFGEYGNAHPEGKSIYRSCDCGRNWEKVYTIPCDRVRHIHFCKWDPYEKKVWVFTGDGNGQCHVLCADRDFNGIEWIGNGTQYFRACQAFFKEDSVHWIMDSPQTEVHHIRLDRKTRGIEVKQSFKGPVWYCKELEDGYHVAATVQEDGSALKDDKLHLMVSRNLEEWEEAAAFGHDGLPKKYFKCGVAAFADGTQKSDAFYIFFEAVKGLDGKAALCALES